MQIKNQRKLPVHKNRKLIRTNWCDLCFLLVDDSWIHILGKCSKSSELRKKHEVNLQECLRNPNRENCMKIYNYIAELCEIIPSTQ